MAAFVDWPDGLGLTHRYFFLIDPAIRPIAPVAGNYMFVRETAPNWWYPLYIGIADNLAERLQKHERGLEAQRLGATRVMAHTQPNTWLREREERLLIGHYNPTMNVQHRTNALGGLFGALYPSSFSRI